MRRRGGAVACVLIALLASACASDADDTLHWYVSTDDFGAATLAQTCTNVDVEVHELSQDDADSAHTELIRRLRGDASSIDLLTVAGSTIPELAAGGLVKKVPASYGEGVWPVAAEQVTVDGGLYAAPWLFDPQLLWYRSVAAERAGLNMQTPVLWKDVIAGAQRVGASVQIADDRHTGLVDWVSAMGAGPEAADIVELYRDSGVGPGPSSDAVTAFAGSQGGFLIAPASTASEPALVPLGTEYGVASYPLIEGSETLGNPGEGLVLAVSAGTQHKSQVLKLIDCLTSGETVTSLVTVTGHVPARSTLSATDPVVVQTMATARTVDVNQHWNAIRRALEQTWSPLSQVSIDETPADSDAAVQAAEQGRLP